MKKFIGVDLGGTNVRVAIVTELGEILEEIKRPSKAQEGPEAVINNIVDIIRNFNDASGVEGIGIGIPGPVDTEKGSVSLATNLPGFQGFPVVDYLKRETGLPVYIDNDANVAGLAEALVGAGKGKRVVYYVTHSTGIGGAMVVNGRVVSGNKGYAGEIGNIVIDRNRPHYTEINTLNQGAVENEASGSAMVRKAQATINPEIQSAYEIFKMYEQNDPRAVQLIETMSYDMGQLLATIAHIVDPHVFVLGGGVSQSRNLYWDKMIEVYKSLVHPQMRDVEFVLAELDEPGVVGAAMLCYSQEN